MFEQFEALIKALADGDEKNSLLVGFGKIHSEFKGMAEARDKAKSDNAPLKEQLDAISEITGLGENLTAEALKELLSGDGNDAEIKTLTEQLNALRQEHTALGETHNDFVKSTSAKDFELALNKSDIFKSVSSEPFYRNTVMSLVKDKVILGEDGNIYEKGTDGKVKTDLVSGKPVSGMSVFNGLVESGAIVKEALTATVKNGTKDATIKTTNTDGNQTVGLNPTEKMKAGRASS